MATISSRSLSKNEVPIWSRNCHYEPAHLTAELVMEYAPLLTQQKLAQLFKIDVNTLMARFGKEYHQAVQANAMKRRAKFDLLLDQLEPSAPGERDEFGYHHGHKDAKTSEYIAAFKVRFGEAPKEEPAAEENALASMSTEEIQNQMHAWALAQGYTLPKKD